MMNLTPQRYRSLNAYLKERFGKKLFKLPLSSGLGCPNLDGTLSFRGCTFCSEGSSDFCPDASLPIPAQIAASRELVAKKAKNFAEKGYIAYFQSYSNTHGDPAYLERILTEAISQPEIEVLSVATRPDCLEEEKLELLGRLAGIKPVWVELGLQTADDRTALRINRGYPTEVYVNACRELKRRGVEVITHLILGLPGEGKDELRKSVRLAGECSDGVKLQLLTVLRGTELEKSGYVPLCLEEYLELLAFAVENLPPGTVIHRLTGDPDKKKLVAPLWCADKKRVLGAIGSFFEQHDVIQGKQYDKP